MKVLTADNVIIDIDQSIIHFFATLHNMIEDIGETDTPIPLPNILSTQLKIMIEWAMHHVNAGTAMPACIAPKPTFNVKGERTREFKKPGHFGVAVERESEHLFDQWNLDFVEKFGKTPEKRFEVLNSLFPATNYLAFSQFYEFICQTVYYVILKKSIGDKCFKPTGSSMSTRECDDRAREMFMKVVPQMVVDDMTEEQKATHAEPAELYDLSDIAQMMGYTSGL